MKQMNGLMECWVSAQMLKGDNFPVLHLPYEVSWIVEPSEGVVDQLEYSNLRARSSSYGSRMPSVFDGMAMSRASCGDSAEAAQGF
jgi:hypothetical protein